MRGRVTGAIGTKGASGGALSKAFPEQKDFQISLTGGEIFMRKDIMSVLDLFREKGYAAGYLTTNGTIITEERAEALADLAARGFLKHISVSVDGPKDLHDAARGLKGTFWIRWSTWRSSSASTRSG